MMCASSSFTHTCLFTLDVTKSLIPVFVVFVAVLPVFVLQRELFLLQHDMTVPPPKTQKYLVGDSGGSPCEKQIDWLLAKFPNFYVTP